MPENVSRRRKEGIVSDFTNSRMLKRTFWITNFETFKDMDIFDLSERFEYYKNYGQIIVGKWKRDQVCF